MGPPRSFEGTVGLVLRDKLLHLWMRRQLGETVRGSFKWVSDQPPRLEMESMTCTCMTALIRGFSCMVYPGLLICLVLLFIDQRNTRDPYQTAPDTNNTNNNSGPDYNVMTGDEG